jgi:hypothetical protein
MGYTARPRRARTRCGMENLRSERDKGESTRDMRKFGGNPEEIQREDRSTGEKYKEILGNTEKSTRRFVQDIGKPMEDMERSVIRYLQEIWGDLRKYREIQEMMGD